MQFRLLPTALRIGFLPRGIGARSLASKAPRPPAPLPHIPHAKPRDLRATEAASRPSKRWIPSGWTLPSASNIARYVFESITQRNALRMLNIVLILHLVTTYVFTIRPCTGPSMLPTISWDGDWVLISKLHRHGRAVEVGDVISYFHPVRQGYKGIKRVVGMPGDFVARDTPGNGEGWMVQVPAGHCWVAGDNQEASRDSRHFGPLPLALVRGKVLARVWPKPKWMENQLKVPEEVALD